MEKKGEYHNIVEKSSRNEEDWSNISEYHGICLHAISNRSFCLSEAGGYFSWKEQKQKCQMEMSIPGLLIFALGQCWSIQLFLW